jgi:hypothetical protein
LSKRTRAARLLTELAVWGLLLAKWGAYSLGRHLLKGLLSTWLRPD